jgi:hypothetical protein
VNLNLRNYLSFKELIAVGFNQLVVKEINYNCFSNILRELPGGPGAAKAVRIRQLAENPERERPEA